MAWRAKTILERLIKIGPLVGFVVLGLFLSGCDDGGSPFALSIHPLYTKLDPHFDPALLGSWVDDEGDVTFIFEKSADQGYALTVVERDGQQESKGEFEAHVVQLGRADFLDIYPKNPEGGSEFHRAHFIPAHTIARLWMERDAVKIALLSADWLKKRIEDKSVDIAYENADGTLILTCPTGDLQNFVDLYANDGAAFSDPLTLQPAEGKAKEE